MTEYEDLSMETIRKATTDLGFSPFVQKINPGHYRIGDSETGFMDTGIGGVELFDKAMKREANRIWIDSREPAELVAEYLYPVELNTIQKNDLYERPE